jgi:hypothetical protein
MFKAIVLCELQDLWPCTWLPCSIRQLLAVSLIAMRLETFTLSHLFHADSAWTPRIPWIRLGFGPPLAMDYVQNGGSSWGIAWEPRLEGSSIPFNCRWAEVQCGAWIHPSLFFKEKIPGLDPQPKEAIQMLSNRSSQQSNACSSSLFVGQVCLTGISCIQNILLV